MSLRAAGQSDVPALTAILAEPEVALWWSGDPPAESARSLVESGDAEAFVIQLDGDTIGCVQCYEEADPDYRHAGLDVFLASAFQGKGLGSEALRVLARHLFVERGHHRLVIDPRADNRRAIRAYERVGFRRVGVMRSYERGADGAWHDGLLMDMLRGELVPEPEADAR